jgi:catechol 2,3-dioxygenase-like lactoylglutathione lyase family enzyme
MKLTRVIIRTRDYRTSCDFYKRLLGLHLASSWQRKDSWGAIFSAGSGVIELIWFPSGAGLEACNYIPEKDKVTVFLEVHDVDIVYQRLNSAGVKSNAPPRNEPWGFRQFAIRDPDNISIVIAQPMST